MADTKTNRGFVGSMPPGWWDANIHPNLNPTQVVERVEEVAPGHPALAELRSIARSFERSRGRGAPIEYRCPVCLDQGLEELTSGNWDVVKPDEGSQPLMVTATRARPVYRKCSGRTGTCRYRVWRLEEAAKKARAAKNLAAENSESGHI